MEKDEKRVKARLRGWLDQEDYTAIVREAAQNKRVLSVLLSLIYDRDDLTGWRAVWALGLAAAVVAATDAEFVRNILRRLLWSLNDESGSIGWRSAPALGAIIAGQPRQFAEFIPLVVALFDLEERHFDPGILWAIGQIAAQDAAAVRFALPHVLARLTDPRPATRGLAARCLGYLGDASVIPHLEALQGDEARLSLFSAGQWQEQSVGALAGEAVAQLKPP